MYGLCMVFLVAEENWGGRRRFQENANLYCWYASQLPLEFFFWGIKRPQPNQLLATTIKFRHSLNW